MPFQESDFSKPEYQEQAISPKIVVIISCEGCNTEPEYFETIKRKLSENLKTLVEIELVDKPDTSSEPDRVLSNLENHIESKFDFKEGVDILWLVIDRESVGARRKAIEAILPICKDKGYSIALSNPTFEFWLLLHVCDISDYDSGDLYENRKINNSRRFLDKELSDILDNGFNKKSGRFNQDIVSIENIKRAMRQEKRFCSSLPGLLDQLGSNISDLIEDFLILDE